MSQVPSAKEIAKHVDRRQIRRKLILFGALITAIVLAVLYGTCGHGWGLGGGGGDGSGSGPAAPVKQAATQCEIRLAPDGITIDGAKVTRDKAIQTCKAAGRALVKVTGNTVQADWDELRTALEGAGIKVYRQGN